MLINLIIFVRFRIVPAIPSIQYEHYMDSQIFFISMLQFVNFTEIMSRNRSPEQKEAAFALAALMEIPFQYKAALSLRLLK